MRGTVDPGAPGGLRPRAPSGRPRGRVDPGCRARARHDPEQRARPAASSWAALRMKLLARCVGCRDGGHLDCDCRAAERLPRREQREGGHGSCASPRGRRSARSSSRRASSAPSGWSTGPDTELQSHYVTRHAAAPVRRIRLVRRVASSAAGQRSGCARSPIDAPLRTLRTLMTPPSSGTLERPRPRCGHGRVRAARSPHLRTLP